jgi:alkylation response protein AidB-like acyl-CoA dehydrogenase
MAQAGALTGEIVVEDMSGDERALASRVEDILPALRASAQSVDIGGAFNLEHVKTLSEAGLLGLVVPIHYGGLGGGLRDLCAATFAMGTACPSTAMAFFFHCSSSSRGLLALEALEAGLFTDEEAPLVKAFAEKVLYTMGRDKMWLANFASESTKSEKAAITISTTAKPVEGGYLINGVKSFGSATGVADRYLVTAALDDGAGKPSDGASLATFMMSKETKGVRERTKWDALGMRGSATHGLILEDAFVPEEDALAIKGAFTRSMQMSRGSFVGNQLAGTAVYAGAAWNVYRGTLDALRAKSFADTGNSMASSALHQTLIGEMMVDMETALLWLRRQLLLETGEPPLKSKADVVQMWRLCKGTIAEAGFQVAVKAMKCMGTSGTANGGLQARAVRDMAMGLVQAFPAERGRLMAAQLELEGVEQAQFGLNK